MTLFIMLALAATIVAFGSGITSMVSNGEVGHYGSAAWMGWRVVFQAVAFVMVLIALLEAH